MIHQHIEAAAPEAADRAARRAGELAIGCADAAGRVAEVAGSIGAQIATLDMLEAVMASLETDQRQVTDATDEARLLSERARLRLAEGGETIAASIAEFAEVTALVSRLGTHITGFAGALEQVRRTTEVIDAIARTTNMLALNAAIEAEQAGDAGRTFAVVAAEVKNLARDTRAATDEIAATMASLTREAESFVGDVGKGVTRAIDAERGFNRVTEAVAEVTNFVDQVDRQTDDIARATSLIHDSVCRVGDELAGFAGAARANSGRLGEAHQLIGALERDANGMLDAIVHSGFGTVDRRFVDIAMAGRDRLAALTEAALDAGRIDMAALFDTDYRLIPGSRPERFDNRANLFADAEWRPLLDGLMAGDPDIVSTAATDINGYLPTHASRYSRDPTGDPAHDAAWCRNRRMASDRSTDAVAKSSTADFHLAAFRRDTDDGGYEVVRNVYVPLYFRGRRWGDLEVAYQAD